MLQTLPNLINEMDTTSLSGIRDKAIILLGFALASRRSELVALEDLEFHDFGVDVRVRETKKNDDLIKGVVLSNNEFCPVKAVKKWMEAANLHTGALFGSIDRHQNINDRLSDKLVASII